MRSFLFLFVVLLAVPAYGELIQYDPANLPKMTSLSDIFGDDLPIIWTWPVFVKRADGTTTCLNFATVKQADGSVRWEQVFWESDAPQPPAHYISNWVYTSMTDDSKENIDRWLDMLNDKFSPKILMTPATGNPVMPYDGPAGTAVPVPNISGGVTTVPEPSTLVILIIGLCSLATLRFRRR